MYRLMNDKGTRFVKGNPLWPLPLDSYFNSHLDLGITSMFCIEFTRH